MINELNRRTFLKISATAAGGLLISFYMEGCGRAPDFSPNAFLKLHPDGKITITIPRPEMGQGVRTSLAMIIADELDIDLSNVKIEQADLDPKYGEQYVGGSSSVRHSWRPLRAAGATARQMLILAAAQKWKINPKSCHTQNGYVFDEKGTRKIPYAQLTSIAATLAVPKDVPLKAPAGFHLIGKRTAHLDTQSIVTGKIQYGIDTRVPEMLFAVVERCPVFDGRIKRFDTSEAKKVAGVYAVIPIDPNPLPEFGEDAPKPASGIAIVASSTWAAMKGAEKLIIDWDFGEGISAGTDRMRAEAIKLAHNAGRWTYRLNGDPEKVFNQATRRVEAIYELPLLAHATMEPMNCTAHVRSDRAEIWAPTQNPEQVRDVVNKITKIPAGKITVHPKRMGGGFGRRFYSDFVAEATIVSRQVGKPVQIIWTREDDIKHGFYRPAGYYVLRGAVDRSGRPVAWMAHLVNASRGHYMKWQPMPGKELQPGEIGSDDFPAGLIPNLHIEYTPLQSPIPRGQWRAVEESSNVFVIQSFLAELADAAGKDELEMNLQLLRQMENVPYYGQTYQSSRLRKVFEVAASRGNWGKPLPAGWGRGIAGSFSNHAYVAQVAEVEIQNDELRVHRIVAAVDCGTVVNPGGVETQVQGAIIFALSAAMKQEITVENGRVFQNSFDDFPLLKINEAPEIEVSIVPSSFPPSGLGEAAVGQTAPAITNAIFHATGKRMRRLPLLGTDLKLRSS